MFFLPNFESVDKNKILDLPVYFSESLFLQLAHIPFKQNKAIYAAAAFVVLPNTNTVIVMGYHQNEIYRFVFFFLFLEQDIFLISVLYIEDDETINFLFTFKIFAQKTIYQNLCFCILLW